MLHTCLFLNVFEGSMYSHKLSTEMHKLVFINFGSLT